MPAVPCSAHPTPTSPCRAAAPPSPAPNTSLHPSKSLNFCARLAVSLHPPPPVAPGLGWRLCPGVAPGASVAGSATGISPSRNVNATIGGGGGNSVKSVSSWPGQIPFLLLQPSLHTAEVVTWEGPIHEQGEGRMEQKSPKWGPFSLPLVHAPVPMSGCSTPLQGGSSRPPMGEHQAHARAVWVLGECHGGSC